MWVIYFFLCRIGKVDVQPHLEEMLSNLFHLLKVQGSQENEYVMKGTLFLCRTLVNLPHKLRHSSTNQLFVVGLLCPIFKWIMTALRTESTGSVQMDTFLWEGWPFSQVSFSWAYYWQTAIGRTNDSTTCLSALTMRATLLVVYTSKDLLC